MRKIAAVFSFAFAALAPLAAQAMPAPCPDHLRPRAEAARINTTTILRRYLGRVLPYDPTVTPDVLSPLVAEIWPHVALGSLLQGDAFLQAVTAALPGHDPAVESLLRYIRGRSLENLRALIAAQPGDKAWDIVTMNLDGRTTPRVIGSVQAPTVRAALAASRRLRERAAPASVVINVPRTARLLEERGVVLGQGAVSFAGIPAAFWIGGL